MSNNFSGEMLPADAGEAVLVGRLQLEAGPTPVIVRNGTVFDVSASAPTVADLLEQPGAASVEGRALFGIGDLPADRLLSPVDLQVVKAAGVTFAVSALERVIEERARGDA